jgi:hypothetical protein
MIHLASVRRAGPAAAALLASALPAAAGDALAHRGELLFGPLVGGEAIVFDLRTQVAGAPLAIFLGLSGAPTVPVDPTLPVINVSPVGSFVLASTDSTGRLRLELGTAPGQFPAATGLALFTQAAFALPGGQIVASNAKACELEPSAPVDGFLVEQGASVLPIGYDQIGANCAKPVDFDRDGWTDLVVSSDFAVSLWRNTHAGSFADVTAGAISFPGDALSCVESGDVDLDGDFDLLTAGGYDPGFSPPDRLWLNDGSGQFAQAPGFPEGLGLSARFELGDADGDGDPDVAVANGPEGHLAAPGGVCQLLVNLGGASFIESAAFAGLAWNDGITPTTALRFGDIDSDGDLDLLAAKSDTQGLVDGFGEKNRLLVNDGLGAYADESAARFIHWFSDNTLDAAFVDLESDGDLDIVCANSLFTVSPAASGDVLRNLGPAAEGFFGDDPTTPLEVFDPADAIRLAVEVGDIDADGDADFLVCVHDLFNGASHMLMLNQGAAQGGSEGAFVKQTWFDPGDFVSFGGALLDLENDGDLDVFMGANGVISGDPLQAFQARMYVNGKL